MSLKGLWIALISILSLNFWGCTCNQSALDQQEARTDPPSMHSVQLPPQSIRLDGLLDDWKNIPFSQTFVLPANGRSCLLYPIQARMKSAWDQNFLYFAFYVDDPSPSSPYSPKDLDPHIWEKASAVEIMLQPGFFNDNKLYFEFQVDVQTALWDTYFDDYNKPIYKSKDGRITYGHQDWKSRIGRAVYLLPGVGYTVEIALPWDSLHSRKGIAIPPKPGDTWKLNAFAFKNGQRLAVAWSPTLGKGNFHYAPQFGTLVFKSSSQTPLSASH